MIDTTNDFPAHILDKVDSKSWIVCELFSTSTELVSLHSIPLFDDLKHRFNDCPCNPEIHIESKDSDIDIYIHRVMYYN